jgi:hypothetical protein
MAINKPDPVRNLGHKATDASLTKNPAGRMVDYTNNDIGKKMLRQPSRLQGVYTSCSDPRSGISSQGNLDKWANYSTKDSYHGKDPKGRGAGSDGHLAPLPEASTKNWADYRDGSESGPGRLEKSGRK